MLVDGKIAGLASFFCFGKLGIDEFVLEELFCLLVEELGNFGGLSFGEFGEWIEVEDASPRAFSFVSEIFVVLAQRQVHLRLDAVLFGEFGLFEIGLEVLGGLFVLKFRVSLDSIFEFAGGFCWRYHHNETTRKKNAEEDTIASIHGKLLVGLFCFFVPEDETRVTSSGFLAHQTKSAKSNVVLRRLLCEN